MMEGKQDFRVLVQDSATSRVTAAGPQSVERGRKVPTSRDSLTVKLNQSQNVAEAEILTNFH